MDEAPVCAICHTSVRATDYFCFNCGANLHPKPPPATVESQIMLYLGSFFLPPMGIIWGLRYIREQDAKLKIIGWIAFGLTILSIFIAAQSMMKIVNSVSTQMNELQGLQGL